MDKKTAFGEASCHLSSQRRKVNPGLQCALSEDRAAPGMFMVQVTSHENVQQSTASQESLLRSLGLSFKRSLNSVKCQGWSCVLGLILATLHSGSSLSLVGWDEGEGVGG